MLGCSALSHRWAVAPVSAFSPAACCVPQACSVVPGSPHRPSTHLTEYCDDVMKKDQKALDSRYGCTIIRPFQAQILRDAFYIFLLDFFQLL